MKPVVLLSLLNAVVSAGWWSEEAHSPAGAPVVSPSVEAVYNSHNQDQFNPADLLAPDRPKSEIYALAFNALDKLKRKPNCHREAARVVMNNCQHLEDGQGSAHIAASEDRLTDYVDSYAASLAICDLSTARAFIPGACAPFQHTERTSVSHAANTGFHVSHEQIVRCVEALYEDGRQWTSYQNNRREATLLCRASRIDVEKDETIQLNEKTAKVMKDYVQFVEVELAQQKEEISKQNGMLNTYVHSATNQIQIIKNKAADAWNQMFGDVSSNMDNLKNDVNHVSNDLANVQRLLNNIIQTGLASNAELATAHQTEVANYGQASRQTNDELAMVMRQAEGMKQYLMDMTQVMMAMAAQSDALSQRQEAMGEKFNDTMTAVEDISIQLEAFPAHIENAITAAGGIDFTAHLVKGLFPSWMFPVFGAGVTVFFGSYGLPPSVQRNLGLAVTGFVVSSIMMSAQSGHLSTMTWFSADSWSQQMGASSPSQMARQYLATTTPFEMDDLHVDM